MAVGIDPTEGPDVLQSYRDAMGYPWTVTLGSRDVLERYGVTQTAVKYGIDRQGTIAFYRGYGVGDAAGWEAVFEDLVQR